MVKSAKLLDVIFNEHLKWNDHVDYIVKKSAKRLYMLRLLKRARCDTKTLISVYFSCIRPILEYSAQVWHYSIPEYLFIIIIITTLFEYGAISLFIRIYKTIYKEQKKKEKKKLVIFQ